MTQNEKRSAFVPTGMPSLEHGDRPTSRFEFWPMWLMYAPVAVYCLLLSVRYGSLTLPLIANPVIPLSGMVGVRKSAVFERAGAGARRWILPWLEYVVSDDPAEEQATLIQSLLEAQGLSMPIVGKPNIGCRGAGVRLLEDEAALREYIEGFPTGGAIQLQQLSRWEAEAGVFYVRHPGRDAGEITSLTLKYTPYVVGDGVSTLGALVAADPRAGGLQHLYRARHADRWDTVIEAGRAYRLVFSASHCRGAIFRDGRDYISARLSKTLDTIFDEIPGFHYGRLDIKFRDLDGLMAGEAFEIIEINGASAESINIWDRDTRLGEALATLLRQYRTLYRLGDANRRRGHRPPGVRALWSAWRYEKNLVSRYPSNH